MKKLFVCLLAALSLHSVQAQTYTFKKGKVLADNVPLAKYDSKGGLFSALRISVASLDDQPLLNLQFFRHNFQNPVVPDDMRWFVTSFPGYPEKKLVCKVPHEIHGAKEVLEVLFRDSAATFIKDNKLDAAALDQYITANNYDYVADSMAVVKMEQENKARISTLMPRDTKQPVELRLVRNTGELKIYDIYQAGMLLGRVEKTVALNYDNMKYGYAVWMKTAPFTYNGKQYEFSPVAYLPEASDTFTNRIILMKDKKELEFKTPGAANAKAEYPMVNLLINSGLL